MSSSDRVNSPDTKAAEAAMHTPGPWRLYERNPLCIEAPSGNVALCNLARASEADARLIAAAPELLAALKLLYREMELSGNAGSKEYGWPKAITASREAIAKAEGRNITDNVEIDRLHEEIADLEEELNDAAW